MSLYNNITIVGNVVRDSVTRNLKNAKGEDFVIVSFTLAVNRNNKDKKEVMFLEVDSFRSDREFKKGDRVLVEGELRDNSYTTKDGAERKGVKIVASSVYDFGGKNTSDSPAAKNNSMKKIVSTVDEEIPL